MDQRASDVGKRRGHQDGHVVQLTQLDRPRVHDARAELRQLEHLLVANLGHLARIRHHARVGRVDALDIGIDLAALGVQRARQCHRGRVRSAAAERGDVLVFGDALEAGDDHHLAVAQLRRDALRVDVGDARARKHSRRANAGLGTGQ